MKQLAWLAPLLFASACSPSLDGLPDATTLSCESSAECPDDRACVRELKRCLQRDNPCIEPDGDGFRTVEPGRRCTAQGGGAGVCLRAACEPSRCGDGIVDRALAAPEECDDGDGNSDFVPDACRTDCTSARCGDGVRDQGEECDDGNRLDEDGCLSSCALNRCGDGLVDPATEECDDCNESDTDACTVGCEAARCGDRFVRAEVEDCDDQNQNPNDGCDACRSTRWNAELLVGKGEGGGIAAAVSLDTPMGLDVDPHGNLYVADYDHHRLLKIELDPETGEGRVTTVAGTGEAGFSGDGGPAPRAQLHRPSDVAVDKLGNLYVADLANHCIRRIDGISGTIETVVGIPGSVPPDVDGDGNPDGQGDLGPATLAQITSADSVAVDDRGNIFLTERTGNLVRWVDVTTGNIARYAGNGLRGNAGDGGRAEEASLSDPSGLSVDEAGNLFISSGTLVRRVDAQTRRISTFSSLPGEGAGLDVAPDGTLAVALPYDGLVVGTSGAGAAFVLAGDGGEDFGGDGGPALEASFYGPMHLAWAPDGTLFVADSFNHRVRRIRSAANRPIDTVAGTGSPANGSCVRNDCVRIEDAGGIAVDPLGRILLSDSVASVLHWVDPAAGTHGLAAGNPSNSGYSGDGGPATQARIYWPRDMVFDPQGNLFLVDRGNNCIRRIDATTGVITTYAGSKTEGDSTEPVDAASLQMRSPLGLALDAQGNLFVSDSVNRRIRRIDAHTKLATIVASDDGTGRLLSPYGLAFDAQGRLLAVDNDSHLLLQIGLDGAIETVAGTGVPGLAGDGGSPLAARLDKPADVAVAPDGSILVADTGNRRVRRISPDRSRIETLAVAGTAGDGDGGPAYSSRLLAPSGLAFAPDGAVLISDRSLLLPGRGRVRRIDPASGIISTVIGQLMPPGDGPLETSRLGSPGALASLELGGAGAALIVADGFTGRVRSVDLQGGRVSTLAGYPAGFEYEGSPAAFGRLLFDPRGIAADPQAGAVYVSESQGHTVRRMDLQAQPWTISTLYGHALDPGDGPGELNGPRGMALDSARRLLYVAEADNHLVRAIDLTTDPATSFVVAGKPGVRGFLDDPQDATEALLNGPEALALSGSGSLYVADTGNHRVRRIVLPSDPRQGLASIETVAGLGLPWCGEGAPASRHPLDSPRGLAVDSHGNLFVAGSGTVWVVSAGADSQATGEDELQIIYGRLPRVGMPESATLCLTGLLLADGEQSAESRLFVLDACQGYLVALDRERL